MVRPIALAILLAVVAATDAPAQVAGAEGAQAGGSSAADGVTNPDLASDAPSAFDPDTSDVATLEQEELPPPIPGCENYTDFCSEGSGRAGSATGSGVYVDQLGDGNTATIAQRRGSNASYARVVQSGDDNRASVDQDAASAFADIRQAGLANVASIAQSGSAHSTASIVQTGGNNQASISQMASYLDNAASVSQSGNRNSIDLTQTGGGNSALLSQDGDDNSLSVAQTGSNNSLTWAQTGSGLSGPSVTMDGNDRALTILQYNMYAPK